MVLDITASKERREPNFALIEEFASECSMPLAYGGGITNVEQATRLLSLGVEKICIQTLALQDLRLLSRHVDRSGSQSVMASVDVKRNWLGRSQLHGPAAGKAWSEPWMEITQQLVTAGAGEILLNAVERDGALSGPDFELIREAAESMSVPLIAVGGIASLADIKAAADAGASAIAAGIFFVFHGPHRAVLITYPNYHQLMNLFKATE